MSKIIRVWYGTAYSKHADEYGRHVKNDIFPLFSKMKGNLGAKVLRRNVEEGVEFMVMTIWDSMESIKEFADIWYSESTWKNLHSILIHP